MPTTIALQIGFLNDQNSADFRWYWLQNWQRIIDFAYLRTLQDVKYVFYDLNILALPTRCVIVEFCLLLVLDFSWYTFKTAKGAFSALCCLLITMI